MNRNTPLLTLAAFSTLALAACQDNAPTDVRSTAAPLADKGGNGKGNGNDKGDKDARSPGYTSAGGVTPKMYDGNTPGDGNETCASLQLSGGLKIEDGTSQQFAGYQFTVSGEDNSVLSFAPVAGRTPTNAITAVVVKGGPAYDVYLYGSAGVTSDRNLTAPANRKGNVPGISHYVVCSVPITPVVTVKKTLVAVMTSDGRGGMTRDGSWSPGRPVIIPQGETRWLQFNIEYQQPAGASGTLTEDGPAVCGTLGSGFGCSSPEFDTRGKGTFTVTSSGSKTITLDITNNTCGGGTLTNTVTFGSARAAATVTIQGQCVRKRLVRVMTSDDGQMVDDRTYHDGKVTIEQGQTRWLEYEISYDLPDGVSATLADDVSEACNTLGGVRSGFSCTTGGFEGEKGNPQSLTVTGNGTRRIIIDIKNDNACGDRDFTNTAVLSRATGPSTSAVSTSATSKVMVWTPNCTTPR